MSNLRNLNQQNPFADLLAAFNSRGADHPFFAAFNPEARDRGPPPAYGTSSNQAQDQNTPTSSDEEPHRPAPPGQRHPHRGGPHHGGPWARGGGRCGGRGFGPWGMRGGFDMSKLGDFLSQFDGGLKKDSADSTGGKDFVPEADIFDTEDAFVVHVSLPGAKKEDVGVNWNHDGSELSIAGVIYRPGDEAFLKTLALDERKVGVFERKVKLGSRETPAQVESDGIAAKMEDGILIVTIPKTEKEFVEVKKVDIE